MRIQRTRAPSGAFTLVELLVVMAIIGILVAILLPTVGHVRSSAQVAQASSQLSALDTGLEAFRAEQSLGGSYPPSAGDTPDNPHKIADPTNLSAMADPDIWIAGAHLLVHAMLGADLLGPPGFVDLNRDGRWSDDTHAGQKGAYELDDDAQTLRARYGGSGFVSDKMKEQVLTLRELVDTGKIVNWDSQFENTATADQFVFVDPWDHPILYYKANKAARRMTTGGGEEPGIYRQEDNAVITGSTGTVLPGDGADFGASKDQHGHTHLIAEVPAGAVPLKVDLDAGVNTILTMDEYEDSFTRFILNRKSRSRNEPVRKDSYLLIGAGPDSVYGTQDDVTNWSRVQE